MRYCLVWGGEWIGSLGSAATIPVDRPPAAGICEACILALLGSTVGRLGPLLLGRWGHGVC